MQSQTCDAIERSARRRWTFAISAFFAAQIALWTYAIAHVSADPSHAVVADYDRIALNWDAERARRDASAALGWTASVALAPAGIEGGGTLRISLVDSSGRAVEADRVVATVFHQARASEQQTVTLVPTQPGVYLAPVAIDRPGKWRLRIRAQKGDDDFRTTLTRVVEAPGASR